MKIYFRLNYLFLFGQKNWRPLMLLAISVVLALIYLIGTPYILYNDSDPLTYFRKAWWYLGRIEGADVPSRGPGYPLWLILTGAASFDFWWALMFSQILMAIAAPVIVYGILAPISCNAGFVASLFFMFFGISYRHMNWVMTEELFMFVELLSFFMISRYFVGQKIKSSSPIAYQSNLLWNKFLIYLKTPYPIAVLLAYCTMVKPAASPFFWLFIGISLLFRIEPWRRYIGPVALYISIMMAWGTHHYLFSPVRFSAFGMPQTLAQRNFADLYYGPGYETVKNWNLKNENTNLSPETPVLQTTIQSQAGPASKKLFHLVETHLASERLKGKWHLDNPDTIFELYGRYKTDAELMNIIFTRPNPFYYSLIWQAVAPAGGDQLLEEVAREHKNTGLNAYFKYLGRHPTLPLKGPSNAYIGYHFFSKFYRQQQYFDAGYFGPRDQFLDRNEKKTIFFQEENGPASRALSDSIRFYIRAFPQFIGIDSNTLYILGGGNELAESIIQQRSSKYDGAVMGWIFEWMKILHGEERMGELLLDAGKESMLSQPRSYGLLWGDFLASAVVFADSNVNDTFHGRFSPYQFTQAFLENFADFSRIQTNLLEATVKSGLNNQLPPEMGKWVGHYGEPSEYSKSIETTLYLQYGLFKWSKPFMFATMLLLAVPIIISRRGQLITIFLILAYLISAAAWVTVMINPASDPRHEDVYAFFPLLVMAIGFTFITDLLRYLIGKKLLMKCWFSEYAKRKK